MYVSQEEFNKRWNEIVNYNNDAEEFFNTTYAIGINKEGVSPSDFRKKILKRLRELFSELCSLGSGFKEYYEQHVDLLNEQEAEDWANDNSCVWKPIIIMTEISGTSGSGFWTFLPELQAKCELLKLKTSDITKDYYEEQLGLIVEKYREAKAYTYDPTFYIVAFSYMWQALLIIMDSSTVLSEDEKKRCRDLRNKLKDDLY